MSNLENMRELLAGVDTPGAFATRRTSPIDDLHLEVKGIGRIAWPISAAAVRRLCASGRPARYGLKDATRLDRRVRDTCEIPKSRIRIDQRRWRETLGPVLDRVRRDLGLPDDSGLNAELHNMLVYGPGQFFLSHQDSEKTDDMIGTLVVILPSAHRGGALVVEHHDERRTFRAAAGKLTFLAFYADCHHEVRPVIAGHRVVLTYNLIVAGDTARTAAPTGKARLDVLAQNLEQFFGSPLRRQWAHQPQRQPPDRFVYLLDHQYTQRSLAWNRLKSADAARAAALREAALRLDCEIGLALADVHETWSCEDDDLWYDRRRRRGWYREHEEAGGDDDGAPEPIELIDSDIELRHWVGSSARLEAITGVVDFDEVCYTKPSRDLQPFRSEHQGYMGNEGSTLDRWYHRAAVALWPRARTFVIRAKDAPGWAVGELTKTLAAGDVEQARTMAGQLAPFWTAVARREERGDFLRRTLRVADGLDDPVLAAALLQPFTVDRLTSGAASRLVALADRYGLEWCLRILETWTPERPFRSEARRLAWLSTLPELCAALRRDGSAHGRELSRWTVANEWTRLRSEVTGLREQTHPTFALDAACRMSKPILGLLEASRISDDPARPLEISRVLRSPETGYPLRGLVHLLRTAHENRSRRAASGLLAPVHEHCIEALTARLSAPAREEGDWSIAAPRSCRCGLCGTLDGFLAAPDRVRFEWPLAKPERAHVHGILDAHGLPVSHVTRRVGRPFTLVLAKTGALFEREAAERRLWQNDLRWLATTARAFEP